MASDYIKLIIQRASYEIVGPNGGFEDVISVLLKPDELQAKMRSAKVVVDKCIADCKLLPEMRTWSDEKIARRILIEITNQQERKKNALPKRT